MASSSQEIRRIVTGHDANGNAIVEKDDLLIPANPLDPDGKPAPQELLFPSFTSIFRTTGHPASAQGSWDDPHGKLQNLVGTDGVMCRIVDFPPMPDDAPPTPNAFHRTVSVDYGVILEGEIDLVLDNGVRTTTRRGDVVVQRGTIHLWDNKSTAMCRVFFVLVPAQPVTVESTGEELQPTDTKILELGHTAEESPPK